MSNHGGKRAGAGVKPKYGEKTVFVSVKIPQSLLFRLEAIAKNRNCSRSETIINGLQSYLTTGETK